MTLCLDITRQYDVWRFIHDDHGVRPGITEEVRDWCDQHLGPHEIDLIYKVVPKFHGDRVGTTEYYHVTLRFREEAKLVHFRLRWGGSPF